MPLWLYALAVIGLFIATIVSVRRLGKSAIVQLTPYDLSTIVILGTIAAEPLVNPSVKVALFGMGVVVLSHIFFSKLTLKPWGNRLLLGEPTILVKHGKIIKGNLAKSRLSVRQLLAMLRFANQPNLADIEYAILEPIGQLSIIPKPKARPLTPEDLRLETDYKGLPLPVIVDGDIQDENLKLVEKDQHWLLKHLRENGYDQLPEILYAGMADKGTIYVNARGGRSTTIRLDSKEPNPDESVAESRSDRVFRREVLFKSDVPVIRDGRLLVEGLAQTRLRKKQIQEILENRGIIDFNQVQELVVEVSESVRMIPRMVFNGVSPFTDDQGP